MTLNQGGLPQTLATDLQYRADGLLIGLTYGNNLTESRLYSLAGRLTSWTVGAETRGFLYDANGNLKERTGAATASFTYDALDRLKDESLNSFTQGFTYDANGNRKSDASGHYDYLASTNRLSTTPTGAITLDAAGNLTAQGARTFGYTASGQPKDITEGTLLVSYAYNGARQRTRKTIGNDTTVYHYDLAGNLLMETDAAGITKKAYVWLNGRPLAQLDSTGIVYLHTDQLDTPRLATNSAGTIVWRWEGEAFGDSAPNEDPDQDGSLTTVNLRFPGQYYDQETGLHYNWNRYYDPKVGRYITSDPSGLWGGLNTFNYVQANPLRYKDATGLRMGCVQLRQGSTSTLICVDDTDPNNGVQTYHMTENACSRRGGCSADEQYGRNRLLAPGYYDLLPRTAVGGTQFATGDPQYTTFGQPAGIVIAPDGTRREAIGPHIGTDSNGCPLFGETPEGLEERTDFYARFRFNVNRGGTYVFIIDQ